MGPGGGGVVVIGDRTHHFGEVPPSQTLTHTFTLENTSRNAVEIVRVKSSCGCTTTDDLEGRVVPPGESLGVPVSLVSGLFDEDDIYGDITAYYRPTAGGETAFVVVRVMASVRTDYEITPTHVDFDRVAGFAARFFLGLAGYFKSSPSSTYFLT